MGSLDAGKDALRQDSGQADPTKAPSLNMLVVECRIRKGPQRKFP